MQVQAAAAAGETDSTAEFPQPFTGSSTHHVIALHLRLLQQLLLVRLEPLCGEQGLWIACCEQSEV